MSICFNKVSDEVLEKMISEKNFYNEENKFVYLNKNDFISYFQRLCESGKMALSEKEHKLKEVYGEYVYLYNEHNRKLGRDEAVRLFPEYEDTINKVFDSFPNRGREDC